LRSSRRTAAGAAFARWRERGFLVRRGPGSGSGGRRRAGATSPTPPPHAAPRARLAEAVRAYLRSRQVGEALARRAGGHTCAARTAQARPGRARQASSRASHRYWAYQSCWPAWRCCRLAGQRTYRAGGRALVSARLAAGSRYQLRWPRPQLELVCPCDGQASLDSILDQGTDAQPTPCVARDRATLFGIYTARFFSPARCLRRS
jgi:hypothetical protein